MESPKENIKDFMKRKGERAVYVGQNQQLSNLLSMLITSILEERKQYAVRKNNSAYELTSVDYSVGSVTQDSKSGGTIQINWSERPITCDTHLL